jgi:class 3 adenylate cyclase/TolB-like protein/predicted negative regulator of RcsB-dependent stress response
MERRLTTVVAMDVVGYSRLMELDEAGTLQRLKDVHEKVVGLAISRYGGRVVKLMGDGVLADFTSVVDALRCAVEIQRELASRNGAAALTHRLQLRIGLHLGDVIVEGADIYGDGVNVASRLEGLADPGGIVLSKQVYDHLGNNVPVRLVSIGEQAVKNISRPIHAYRVDLGEKPSSSRVIAFHEFELDTGHFELREKGERVPVEPQVFDLLVLLARNANRTVTREEIFSEIWSNRVVSESALSSQIKAARRAVGDDGSTQRTIATVHGRGFRFVAPIKPGTDGEGGVADTPVAAASAKPVAAVLPFINLNADPSEDYLVDGISEDITTLLSKHRWLGVIARNPAFAFRGSRESLRLIGQKLGADYLVTGSVRRVGERFRVTVQLVEAATEHSVWSERFDRHTVDIFELQDDISRNVASRIEAELGIAEQKKAEGRPRKNLGAWDLYQLGVAEFYKFTPDANRHSQDLLRRAIELDPTLASAHSRLAYAVILSMVYFDAPTDEQRMDAALATATRAIDLDDQDANGFFTLGRVHLARRDYAKAIDALQQAIELNPSLAVTYCGLGDSYAYEGRLDDAIDQFETAIQLSPHDPFRWAFFSYRSLAHLFRHEFVEAATWARRSIQIPKALYWAHAHLVSALGHTGDADQTGPALADLKRVKPEFTIQFARERLFYLKREEQLELYLAGLRKAGVAET